MGSSTVLLAVLNNDKPNAPCSGSCTSCFRYILPSLLLDYDKLGGLVEKL